MPRRSGILSQNVAHTLPERKPVVDFRRRIGNPARPVASQFDLADGGHIPEKTVIPAGYHEGNGHLCVALIQFDNTSFLIQESVGMLA
jgi:hypothetical protein